MPDYNPNQVVRAFAVIALIAAFVAVVALVATSGGGSGGGGNGGGQEKTKAHSKRGRNALRRRVWIVRPGDTLGKISQETGIDIDTLTQLNPDVDPQTLLEGQRIQLAASAGGGANGGAQVKKKTPTLSVRGQVAVSSGVWIVRSGDTLTDISDETRIPIDTLIKLNPGLDPETLTEGQRIALR
jgi:LysM repeat protein